MYNNQIPEEYQPLGMWAYFGYTLLFSIPLAGFICILVFAFGGSDNINLRNFARSYLCWYILAIALSIVSVIVLLLIAVFSGLGLAAMFPDMFSYRLIFGIPACMI